MVAGNECLVEGCAQVLADSQKLSVASLAGQAVGIVGSIEKGDALVRLIDLACGTVNGLLLRGIDFTDATAEAVHLRVDILDVQGLHEEQVAITFVRSHDIHRLPVIEMGKHLLRGGLDASGLLQSLDKLDDDVAVAGQQMLRTDIIISQVAQRGQRLQIAHQAVVEEDHLRMLDVRSLEGPLELIHVHAAASETPVVEHGTGGSHRLLEEVVKGIEAGTVAVEHQDIVLRRGSLGSPVNLRGEVLLTVELELRILLKTGLGAQLLEVGVCRQFEAQHLVLVGIPAHEGACIVMMAILIEEQHAYLLLTVGKHRLQFNKHALDNVVHMTAGMTVDEQGVVCQILRRRRVFIVVFVVTARCQRHGATDNQGTHYQSDSGQRLEKILFHCLFYFLYHINFHRAKIQHFFENETILLQ